MIISFKHKGLQNFFATGSKRGVQSDHATKLARILDRLDASIKPEDMALPGYNLHPLTGKQKGTWSVWVSGNWWVMFQIHGEVAIKVDYTDYH